MKNKKVVMSVAAFGLMVWCTKDLWTSSKVKPVDIDFSESPKKLVQTWDPQDLLKKDDEIAKLKVLISKMKLTCGTPSKLESEMPKIYAVTPTHYRPVQKAELTRLSHTLMLVPNLHWVVIEDSEVKTDLVSNLLSKTGMSYTHLNAATPKSWKPKAKEPRWVKPRGVIQRNTALEWIRNNVSPHEEGVLYFADDDNSYTLELFEQMRGVTKVGVWPVGLVGGLMVERPKINQKGKVSGWLTVWSPNRPFAIDMAGFAINLQLFHSKPEGKFSFESEKGYQESELLKHFVDSLDELEVKADNCTKVYVWHTRTEAANLAQEVKLRKEGSPRSDAGIEV